MPLIAIGDEKGAVTTFHVSPCDLTTKTDECSLDVFVGGVGVVRAGDKDALHKYNVGDNCQLHQVGLSTYSLSVKVNGEGVGRVGDYYGIELISDAGQESVSAGV